MSTKPGIHYDRVQVDLYTLQSTSQAAAILLDMGWRWKRMDAQPISETILLHDVSGRDDAVFPTWAKPIPKT